MKQLVLNALLAGIMVISKEMLAALPNVELVTFLVIMFSLYFPLKDVIMMVCLFSTLEMLLYGVGFWTPMYYLVFSGYAVLTHLLAPWLVSPYRLAFLSGIYGLVFGLLFAIPYALIDWHLGWAYFLNGLIFDAIHAIGNYILMLLLAEPMQRILKRLVANGH